MDSSIQPGIVSGSACTVIMDFEGCLTIQWGLVSWPEFKELLFLDLPCGNNIEELWNVEYNYLKYKRS